MHVELKPLKYLSCLLFRKPREGNCLDTTSSFKYGRSRRSSIMSATTLSPAPYGISYSGQECATSSIFIVDTAVIDGHKYSKLELLY